MLVTDEPFQPLVMYQSSFLCRFVSCEENGVLSIQPQQYACGFLAIQGGLYQFVHSSLFVGVAKSLHSELGTFRHSILHGAALSRK